MVTEYLLQYLELCFTGPNLPATLLMILILLYGAMVIVGALDIEMFDFDLDTEADADAMSSVGFVALRFLNIGEVPIMIWISTFGLGWWTLSLLLWSFWDQETYEPGRWAAAQIIVRNVALSVVLTKIVTQPLVKIFERQEQFKAEDLVGRECVISTHEATSDFGQAKFKTEAAPLLLNVKTEVGKMSKGDTAVIVDYDTASNVYLVVPVSSEPVNVEDS